MDNKLILPCEVENVSDGYHTFKELYEHRITLYIALCKNVEYLDVEMGKGGGITWRSELHSDGTKFKGWFILGINYEKGKQITYHLPMSRWNDTKFARTLDKAPEWDGHTPQDVLERIKSF